MGMVSSESCVMSTPAKTRVHRWRGITRKFGIETTERAREEEGYGDEF